MSDDDLSEWLSAAEAPRANAAAGMPVWGRAAKARPAEPMHRASPRPSPSPRFAAPRDTDADTAAANDATPFGDALPLQDFVRQLEREKRRSDRCKAPLSLALYRTCGDARHTVAFLDVLHLLTRETDVIGNLGNDTVALLCPDTDADCLRSVLRRIEHSAQGLPVQAVTAVTHPDLLFDMIGESRLPRDGPAAAPGSAEALRFGAAFISDRPARQRHGYALKRVIDVVGASICLLSLSPLMALTAVAVGLTSRGPIIFRQTRLGQGGRPFVFYKFRSMRRDGDERIHRAFVADLINDEGGRREGDPAAADRQRLYKLTADPRITPVGRLIRKTSIDELPQLLNVLMGDMSLVGPRPPIPYEAARYQAWHLRRLLTAKPGLTGLWQVEGRSKVSFNEMVRMDLRYIRDCSLGLDLRIMLKTVKVVLAGEGAA